MKRLLLAPVALVASVVAGLVGFTAWTARRVTRALPPGGSTIEAGGERIHYLDRGSGPPIVLVHGLAGNLGHFAYDVIDRLASDHRVIALDRPGSGHSVRSIGASARLPAQGDLVAALIETLDLGRPLLVGHSLGGAIALATALDHPERIGGLALIAPLSLPARTASPVFRLLAVRSPLLRRVIAWTVATPLALLRSRDTLSEVFGPEAPPRDFATRAGGLLGLRPSTYIGASTDFNAIAHDLPGLADRYGTLGLPVGVLYGSGDRILDHRKQGEALRGRIPGVDVELIDGAGHMLPVTRGEAVASFIRRRASMVDLPA